MAQREVWVGGGAGSAVDAGGGGQDEPPTDLLQNDWCPHHAVQTSGHTKRPPSLPIMIGKIRLYIY